MTAQAVKAEPEYGYKGPRKLLVGELKRAEFETPQYRIIVRDEKTTVEEVLRPEFWANVSEMFSKDKPFPIIELIWADCTKYLKVIVMASGRLFSNVRVLELQEWGEDQSSEGIEAPKPKAKAAEKSEEKGQEEGTPDPLKLAKDDPAGYQVKYCGPVDKHCVIRLSDGEKLEKEMATKAEAQKWLDEYLKALK